MRNKKTDLRNGEAIVGNDGRLCGGRINGSGNEAQLGAEPLTIAITIRHKHGSKLNRNGSRPSRVAESGTSRMQNNAEKPVTGADGGPTWHRKHTHTTAEMRFCFIAGLFLCFLANRNRKNRVRGNEGAAPQPPKFGVRGLLIFQIIYR